MTPPNDEFLPTIASEFQNYERTVVAIADLIRQAGYQIDAFRAGHASNFWQLDAGSRNAIRAGLHHFHELCTSAQREGIDLGNDGRSAAWWVIRSLGWRPLSDVFSHITSCDILEIYSRDHVQLFRSFNMFRFISYSLDELVTHEWAALYSRPAAAHTRVMAVIQRAIDEARTMTEANGEQHVITEIFSLRRRSAVYEARIVSPLLSAPHHVAGYINVLRAHPLGDD